MGFADLHIHTVHSYDATPTVPAVLKYVAARTDLKVIAITDHDTMDGVKEALDLAPSYGIEVIPGCEVSTAEGHLLTLFVDRPIQPGLSYIETIRRVKAVGGICIASHPTARFTSSVTFETLARVIRHPDAKGVLVGVEAFNGGLVYTSSNRQVASQSRALALAQVGNSDAHILKMIGQGSTGFPGRTAADLRQALARAETRVRFNSRIQGWDVMRHYLPRLFLRLLGWVDANRSPNAPIELMRLSSALAIQHK